MRPLLLAIALAGCFSPSLQEGRPCGEPGDVCPPGQFCDSEQICRSTAADGGGDGGGDGAPATIWKRLVTGSYARHTCGIRASDDSGWCWGMNESGQLGDGTEVDRAAPTENALTTTAAWLDVTTGPEHTCAIVGSHDLYCWGYQADGRLGNGSDASLGLPTPVFIDPPGGWIDVAAGIAFTCALDTGGAAWCWGTNDTRQLGVSTIAADMDQLVPVPVEGGHTFTAIEAGDEHVCAIDADGQLWCWGDNGNGEVGRTPYSPEPALIPERVTINGVLAFSRFSTGGDHTCAISDAERVYCWGDNLERQSNPQSSDVRILPSLADDKLGWKEISAGEGHTCAVRAGDELWCWGGNEWGQLAIEEIATFAAAAAPLPDYTRVTAGRMHTCGLHADGSASCFGGNERGQLGAGALGRKNVPSSIGTTTWASVSAALGHHACAIGEGDTLWCWGSNDSEQLGDGTTAPHAQTPVQVGNLAGPGPVGWRKVVAGALHSCAIFGEGDLYCWGRGVEGQLGVSPRLGSTRNPTAVAGDWLDVAAGDVQTCGIKTDGSLWCWGDWVVSDEPVQVGTDAGWSAIAAGYGHQCALAGQAAFCWGANGSGQLGTGDTNPRTLPTPVVGTWAFSKIVTGVDFTCGIAAGEPRPLCWGFGSYGKLGNGDQNERSSPTPITALMDQWTDIAVGHHLGCAVRAQVLSCWGDDSSGQVGRGVGQGLATAPVALGGSWTSVDAGEAFACAVGVDERISCWGENDEGQLGDGSAWRASPGAVVAP